MRADVNKPFLKHGARMLQTIPVREFPAEYRELFEDVVTGLLALPHLEAAKHGHAIEQVGRMRCVLAAVYAYIAENGITDKDGELRNALKMIPALENSFNRMLQSLGLTPIAAKRIHLLVEENRPPWIRALSGEGEVVD